MARSVEEINDYLKVQLVAQFASVGITIDTTTWSKRNYMRNFLWVFAIAQNYFEQLQDLFIQQVEAIQLVSHGASAAWIQYQMINFFQYSATVPQYLIISAGVYSYPIIDPTLHIIAACSVTTGLSGRVYIKCAQMVSGSLAALDGSMVSAAQGFINLTGDAGIYYTVSSADPDRLYIDANIYYKGLYASTIQADVISAINAFLANQGVVNFNGNIELTDLIRAIKDVPGVNDVILNNVNGRAATTAFVDGTGIVVTQQWINRQWATIAGYMISEDDTGHTLADSLTFNAE